MGAFTKNYRSVTGGQFTKIVKGIGGSSGGSTASGGTADRPASGTTGDMFFDTDLDKLYVWNGSAWVDVT